MKRFHSGWMAFLILILLPHAAAAVDCLSVDESLDLVIPCVAYEGGHYTLILDSTPVPADPEGLYWRYGSAAATEPTGSPATATADLTLTIPCVRFNAATYRVTLTPARNPDDPDGIYWRFASAVPTAVECIPVGSDLKITIPRVTYQGTSYAIDLAPYTNPTDPDGLYWRLGDATPVEEGGFRIDVGESVALMLPCVTYDGMDLAVALSRYGNPRDRHGLYWNLAHAEVRHKLVNLITDYGEILVWLHPETPAHRDNFINLVESGFYTGLTFHRVIDGFVIQGGDPSGDGTGGPDYTLPAEIVAGLDHGFGAVAAARLPDPVNPERRSSGSQFYIVENRDGVHDLDGQYTVFGQVISGLPTVEAIGSVPTTAEDRPKSPVVIRRAETVSFTPSTLATQYGFAVPTP